jgi:hypothetical protein
MKTSSVFYRDAVIAGHNELAAETIRHLVRLLNETIAGCEGQDHPQLEVRRTNDQRKKGGINKCAARFARCLGRWEMRTRRG